MKKILVIEDEPHIAEGLKFNLESEGYEVRVLDNAEDGVSEYEKYDMLVLDIMLPGMNGFEFLRIIRKKNKQYPVLVLSAKTSENNRIEGLSAGADDYMTKPFSLSELILRIKRILERQLWYSISNKEPEKKQHTFGEIYTIDFETLEAKTNDGRKNLTRFEAYVMKYLIENSHRTVSRDEILKKVWGYNEGIETRTVDIFIGRLRKYFEKDRKNPVHIKSIRGVGYRFFNN